MKKIINIVSGAMILFLVFGVIGIAGVQLTNHILDNGFGFESALGVVFLVLITGIIIRVIYVQKFM